MYQLHLPTLVILSWEVQKLILQLYSIKIRLNG